MPRQTKIFRVFVSSTFADMTEERQLLLNDVFPQLDRLCQESGARFQAIDLRWGVSEKSQIAQRTMQICLGEIARCQRISPRPNFIILLGDRYGWQPIPEKIPSLEFEGIVAATSGGEASTSHAALLNRWYRRDDNALPCEYVLQPRPKKEMDWSETEDELRAILRTAVDRLGLDAQQRTRYFASATHQEIVAGLLRAPKGSEPAKNHVFAYVKQEPPPHIRRTLSPDHAALKVLKAELAEALGDHYCSYPVEWEQAESRLVDPKEFTAMVFAHMAGVIKQEIREIKVQGELAHERDLHREIQKSHLLTFEGRADVLQQIATYMNDEKNTKVLSIMGPSGSGKSSVMAKAAFEAEANPAQVVIYRFLGTTSSSTGLRSLIGSLRGEITERYLVGTPAESGLSRPGSPDPETTPSASLYSCLALAHPGRTLAVFLDGLDQLSEADGALWLDWLPRTLPLGCKLIVSALPTLLHRLEVSTDVYRLPPLQATEAWQMLNHWLKDASRQLRPEQANVVLSSYERMGAAQRFEDRLLALGFLKKASSDRSGEALHLRLAFEQARNWHSDDADLSIPEDVPRTLDEFFSRIEEDHTPELVSAVVGNMVCGRYGGLAEDELLDLLWADEKFREPFIERCFTGALATQVRAAGRIPVVVWSRLQADLEPYLAERDADGAPIICFYHRQFTEFLMARYVEDGIRREAKPGKVARRGLEQIHATLAHAFAERWKRREDGSRDARVLAELPFHLARAGAEMRQRLSELLSSIAFIAAKVEAGMVFQLVSDYRDALTLRNAPTNSPKGEELQTAVRDWADFFRRHESAIADGGPAKFWSLASEQGDTRVGREVRIWAQTHPSRNTWWRKATEIGRATRESRLAKIRPDPRCHDPTLVALERGWLAASGDDRILRIYDRWDGQAIDRIAVPDLGIEGGRLYDLHELEEGLLVGVCQRRMMDHPMECKIVTYHVDQHKWTILRSLKRAVRNLLWLPGHKALLGDAIYFEGRHVALWLCELDVDAPPMELKGHSYLASKAVIGDHNTIVSAGLDGKLIQWDCGTGEGQIVASAPEPVHDLARMGNGDWWFLRREPEGKWGLPTERLKLEILDGEFRPKPVALSWLRQPKAVFAHDQNSAVVYDIPSPDSCLYRVALDGRMLGKTGFPGRYRPKAIHLLADGTYLTRATDGHEEIDWSLWELAATVAADSTPWGSHASWGSSACVMATGTGKPGPRDCNWTPETSCQLEVNLWCFDGSVIRENKPKLRVPDSFGTVIGIGRFLARFAGGNVAQGQDAIAISVYEAVSGPPLLSMQMMAYPIGSPAEQVSKRLVATDSSLAYAPGDGTIVVWSTRTNEIVRRIDGLSAVVRRLCALSGEVIVVEFEGRRLSSLDLTTGAWNEIPLPANLSLEPENERWPGFVHLLALPPSALLCTVIPQVHWVYDLDRRVHVGLIRSPTDVVGYNQGRAELYLKGLTGPRREPRLEIWSRIEAQGGMSLKEAINLDVADSKTLYLPEADAFIAMIPEDDVAVEKGQAYEIVRRGERARVFDVRSKEESGCCRVVRTIIRTDISRIQCASFQHEGAVGYSFGKDALWRHDLETGTSTPLPMDLAALGIAADVPKVFVTREWQRMLVSDMKVAPDGRVVLFQIGWRFLALDTTTGAWWAVGTPCDEAHASSSLIAPDSRTVALVSFGNNLQICDLASGKVISVVPGGASWAAFSGDGSQLRWYGRVSSGVFGAIEPPYVVAVWDVRRGVETERHTIAEGRIPRCLTHVGKGGAFLEMRRAFDPGIYLSDVNGERRVVPWDVHDDIEALKVNGNGTILAGLVRGQGIHFWALPSGRPLGLVEGSFSLGLDFVLDERTIACTSDGGNRIQVLRLNDELLP
jgi:hypothetical protein